MLSGFCCLVTKVNKDGGLFTDSFLQLLSYIFGVPSLQKASRYPIKVTIDVLTQVFCQDGDTFVNLLT